MLATLISVAILHWVILVTPGANVLVVSQLAASGARRAACFAALGVTVVAVIWASLAAFGVHAVFEAHPHLRFALQLAGGAYLCYVAIRLWRSAGGPNAVHAAGMSPWAAFRLGFFTNIMNPKSALFFGSVFVTSLPHEPDGLLMFAVVAMVLANALAWHLFLALAFSHPRVQSTYARRRHVLNRAASMAVGTFGLRLILTTAAEIRTKLGGGGSAI
jgi:threonine efflux protein